VRTGNRGVWAAGLAVTCLGVLVPSPGWGQAPKAGAVPVPVQAVVSLEQPDAQRTREELSRLLGRYPPTLRHVLALDPTLLGNAAYLAPYPALAGFLSAHPEIARNPLFYVGEDPPQPRDNTSRAYDMWRDILGGLAAFTAVGMAIGLIAWLIRTLIDYRRWSRLSKVQTDVHTKLLDRFTANDDLRAYIQSAAGSKFLESSPIKLDAGPKTLGAPLGRILWSLQGGLVMMAGGVGLQVVGGRVAYEAGQPLHALGVIAVALGVGFVISAIISYVISRRLGLIEPTPPAPQAEPPAA
jgi:hypothetical protein